MEDRKSIRILDINELGEIPRPRDRKKQTKELEVGGALPYGPRLYYQDSDTTVRMRDYGVGKRIILVGVLGSFTPDCWNRHLYLVLKYYPYYKARGVDHVICLATNDAYTQAAWGVALGCSDTVVMLSDPNGIYTKALGMSVVVPWLDSKIRCKRFVLLADNMEIKKLIKCETDGNQMKWDCDHLVMVGEGDPQD